MVRDTTVLGRTGLTCSVVGLGCGGMSRLGLRKGGTMREAADLVRYALDLGITLIDTAKVYGTEPAVGAGLEGRRDGVIVSTKVWPLTPDNRVDPAHITTQIEDSLRVLRVDVIDIVHLHGVTPEDYARIVDGCLPAMERARIDGKIRHIAISELWNQDLSHGMLPMALEDNHFDVVMVGCNMLNSSARRVVLPKALERNVATLLMFAVRRAFADVQLLGAICTRLVSEGRIGADAVDQGNPLGFLLGEHCATLTEAAYRYCRHLAGINVVLTGTGDRDHLRQNIAAIEGPPLPEAALRRIDAIFGRVDSVTGEA
jgi:L-galactose dehydrogenase